MIGAHKAAVLGAAGSGGVFNVATLPGILSAHRWDLGVFEGVGNPAEVGDAVTEWQDQSGNSRHLTPGSSPTLQSGYIDFATSKWLAYPSANKPTFGTSGKFTMVFRMTYGVTPASFAYTHDLAGGGNQYCAFIKRAASTAIRFYGTPAENAYATGLSANDMHTFTATNDRSAGPDVIGRYNGTQIFTTDAIVDFNGYAIPTIGSAGSGVAPSNNRIAGVIICGAVLTGNDLTNAEAWVAGLL